MPPLTILIYPVLSSEYSKPINHDMIQCFVIDYRLIYSNTLYLKPKTVTVFRKRFAHGPPPPPLLASQNNH